MTPVAEVLFLFAAGSATALATGLGAIPVFRMGERARALEAPLLGLAAGVMTVASIAGLLLPGLDQGSAVSVGAGVAVGAGFLLAARSAIEARGPIASTRRERGVRTSLLVFVVLFVHSLPEGLAIGTAYASDTAGLGAFVLLAIAIQNVPEGTAVAIPMAAAGYSARRQFWAAVLTSAPQPIAAPAAYLLVHEVQTLLPFSFGLAAGAMLTLVVVEMLPEALREGDIGRVALGGLAGAAAMLVVSVAFGV